MIGFENTIRIERPIEEVFSFVSDNENIPKWNYYVTDVTKTTPGNIGPGTTYHMTRKTDQKDFQIVELNVNELLIAKTMPPTKPELVHRITFQADGDSTVITDSWKTGTGLKLPKFVSRGMKNAVNENLHKLKTLLEVGEVALQDSRIVRL